MDAQSLNQVFLYKNPQQNCSVDMLKETRGHAVWKGNCIRPGPLERFLTCCKSRATLSSWQQDMLQKVSWHRKRLGWKGLAPSLLNAQILQQSSRVLKEPGAALTCGSRTRTQTTATSEHSSHNIKKPKLEISREKCHIIKYALIRTSQISI